MIIQSADTLLLIEAGKMIIGQPISLGKWRDRLIGYALCEVVRAVLIRGNFLSSPPRRVRYEWSDITLDCALCHLVQAMDQHKVTAIGAPIGFCGALPLLPVISFISYTMLFQIFLTIAVIFER